LAVDALAHQIRQGAAVVLEAAHLTQAMRQGLLDKEIPEVKAA
jgi:hypothetical protein